MKPINTTPKALTTLLSLLFTAPVFASQCNDNAPLADLENVENGYFNLDGNPISDRDKAKLEKLATKLRGHWKGIELTKECVGHFSNPSEELQHYEVRAEITRHDTGAIRLQAEKERQSDHVIKLDTMFISPEIDAVYGRIQGWHTLDFISEDTMIFSHKSRVANGATLNFDRLQAFYADGQLETIFPTGSQQTTTVTGAIAPLPPTSIGTSRLLHEVKKIELRANKLIVDRKLFVNGFFVEQNGWTLERS